MPRPLSPRARRVSYALALASLLAGAGILAWRNAGRWGEPSGLPGALARAREAGCPSDMVLFDGPHGPTCIQAVEATVVQRRAHARVGSVPTTLISFKDALTACSARGAHLCTSQEWEDACDGRPGPGGARWATPDGQYRPGECAAGDARNRIRLARLAPGGSYPACHTPTWIYDLLGNAWEWTDADPSLPVSTARVDKRGGGYYSGDPAPCTQAARGSHAPEFDGTIAVRCCFDPAQGR
jgi:hypothetical protein